jgi:hypothetical protein
MKEIITKKGIIKTPWFRVDEAADYCGLSTTDFMKYAKDLPCYGNARIKVYHVDTLDEWLDGELDIPVPPKTNGNEDTTT